MCEASVHVPHRKAKDKERMVLDRTPHHGMKGFYPYAPKDGADLRLICCQSKQKLLLKQVTFERGVRRDFLEYEGKRNVEVTFQHRTYRTDQIIFPNGAALDITWLVFGTRVDIGIPVRKRVKKPGIVKHSTGMMVVDRAIAEVLATGEGEKPDQPAPDTPQPGKVEDQPGEKHDQPGQPQPVQQPETEQPKAARSSRRARVPRGWAEVEAD